MNHICPKCRLELIRKSSNPEKWVCINPQCAECDKSTLKRKEDKS